MHSGGKDDQREFQCLVRATDGDKISISTHVSAITLSPLQSLNALLSHSSLSSKVTPDQLDRFHQAYGALLKSSMPTLRKRDKKKEKERAELIALRKKRLSEPIIIEGPKRGKGRRKRQRLIKAALKQEEVRKKVQGSK